MAIFLIKQEFLVNIKYCRNLIQSLLLFLITSSIFAITSNFNQNSTKDSTTSIAIIWICLIFAILLSSNHLQRDFEDGTFEQLYLSGFIFEIIILSKILCNWLFNILPLIIFLPPIALILKVPELLIFKLIISATITSLLINFLTSFGSSLTLGNNNSALLTILVLPLLIPIIIFANSSLIDSGTDFISSIKLMLALVIFLIPILTFATSFAVKINLID